MIIAPGPFSSGGGLVAPPPDPPADSWPVLSAEGEDRGTGSPLEGMRANRDADLFWHAPAVGVQELVAGEASLAASVERWRERMRSHSSAACLHLTADAADLPAAELYALPFVPAEVARERERFGAYATRTMGGNLLGDLVQEEVRKRERIVAIDDEGVLMCAFAARVPYHLLLAPRVPRRKFEDDGAVCGELLEQALARLGRRLGPAPSLRLWVRTAPRGAEQFCWRIEIVPRGWPESRLEGGTGIPVNPVTPEVAAAELRAV